MTLADAYPNDNNQPKPWLGDPTPAADSGATYITEDGIEADPTPAQAEVQRENPATADVPAGCKYVHLGPEDGGIDVLVPPQEQWRNSSLSAVFKSDFQAWADATLTGKDAVAWEDYDPTLDEMNEFFIERMPAAFGTDTGKSLRSGFGSRANRRAQQRANRR